MTISSVSAFNPLVVFYDILLIVERKAQLSSISCINAIILANVAFWLLPN
jgi:hypothetical protein